MSQGSRLLQSLNLPKLPQTITRVGTPVISTAQAAVTGSTSSFYGADGTNDICTIPYRPEFDIATQTAWCLELWWRPTSVTGIKGLANLQDYATVRGWGLYANGTNMTFLDKATGFTNATTSGVTLAINTWYHVAVVRNSANLNVYIDGTSRYGITNYTAKDKVRSAPLRIGEGTAITNSLWEQPTSYNRSLVGYIDEFRISNTARYTANFTRPSATFDYDNNTVILLRFEGSNNATTFEESVV